MKNKSLYLIDSMNLFYRSLHAYKRLSFGDESVSAIYGMPSLIADLIFKERPDKLIVIWDGDRSALRESLLPKYKVRKTDRLMDWDNVELQKSEVRKILHSLGVSQVLNPKAEADDLIYKLARIGLNKLGFTSVRILSSDKDFNQLLVDDRITILNPSKGNLISAKSMLDYYPYSAHETVDWLSLVGNDSDNIPGYPGMGPVKTRIFLDTYKSIHGFLEDKKATFSPIDRKLLIKIAKRNSLLIDLAIFYNLNKELLVTKFYNKTPSPKFNLKDFKKLAKKWGLNKFLLPSFTDRYKWLSQ